MCKSEEPLPRAGLIERSLAKDLRMVLDFIGHSWANDDLVAAMARLRSWLRYTE